MSKRKRPTIAANCCCCCCCAQVLNSLLIRRSAPAPVGSCGAIFPQTHQVKRLYTMSFTPSRRLLLLPIMSTLLLQVPWSQVERFSCWHINLLVFVSASLSNLSSFLKIASPRRGGEIWLLKSLWCRLVEEILTLPFVFQLYLTCPEDGSRTDHNRSFYLIFNYLDVLLSSSLLTRL